MSVSLLNEAHVRKTKQKYEWNECTFIIAGHRLDWYFVVVVLTYWKCEDAHLRGEEVCVTNWM